MRRQALPERGRQCNFFPGTLSNLYLISGLANPKTSIPGRSFPGGAVQHRPPIIAPESNDPRTIRNLAHGRPQGPLLPPRRLPYRPSWRRQTRGRDPWPFRPCAARARPCACHARDARRDAGAAGETGAKEQSGRRLRRTRDDRRRRGHAHPGRPCARQRAGPDRMEGRAGRRLRRLQAKLRPDLPGLRARPLPPLHYRGDVRASRVPARRCGRGGGEAAQVPRRNSRTAPMWSASTGSANASA